jgi:hypothetical protein
MLKHGLFHHRGVFLAPPTFGLPVRLASGIPAEEKSKPQQLILLACLFDTSQYEEGKDFLAGPSEYRFTSRVSPDALFAVITHESVRCIGETLATPDRVAPAKFLLRDRKWIVATRNPCCFGADTFYRVPGEWLRHYMDVVLDRNRCVTLLELFNGVYMNVTPMAALPVGDIAEYICRHCEMTGPKRNLVLLKKEDRQPAH